MTQKAYPQWDLYFGFHHTLDFKALHEKSYPIYEINNNFTIPMGLSLVQINNVLIRYDINALSKKFDYIFVIQYYDYNHPASNKKIPNAKSKLEMCKVLEFGFPENLSIPEYKILNGFKPSDNSDLFMVHFDGHTDKLIKTPTLEEQEIICNEIREMGYNPFDVHLNNRVVIKDSIKKLPSFFDPEYSLRNKQDADLNLLIETIKKCKYAIGILSGPILLAINILGKDRCIVLEKTFKAKNYLIDLPSVINVDSPYIKGDITKLLK
jgi:hypothetical protein